MENNSQNTTIKKLIFLGLVLIGTNTEKLFFYNEEVVVAFCFLSFMIFSFRFIGNSLKASLDERNNAIFHGLYSCINTEEAYCDQFFSDVNSFVKISPSLASCLALILLKKQWYFYLRNKYRRLFFVYSINKIVNNQVIKKIKNSKSLMTNFKDQWLNSTANRYQAATILECKKA